ncbi:polyketide synthase PksN [Alteromonadaceae bacterium 2753L.S.0a.02]|nr:polyketide synthase PksN [Alteromonadaceae bacterium 2753L.S.0a.02]
MDIAIIGVACKFPQADNIDQYWNNLISNTSCISEIPAFRWDWKEYWGDPKKERNKSLSKWAGFVDDVDKFDANFFGLLPKVVSTMDPQQRISLELAWECIESAGTAPSSLRGSRTGVFCGVFNHDYKELQESQDLNVEAHHSTGTASTIIANRISHFFDFKGPSFPIDTACSGSLNAIHSAIQAIEFGDCDLALAGGVNLILTPTRHISFSKMGMLSPTGRCNTFDDSANGYVRGEGAAFLLLKPLEKAVQDGDLIQGVIKGSAVNHCGETYTLTYPSPDAQADVICEAHRRANIPLNSVNYIETHGTGTPKGDPIEIQGLLTAYSQLALEQQVSLNDLECYLGAVKTNIGHLEAAAGIAGIIKILASFKHKTLAPLQNFRSLNNRISLEDTPFKVLAKKEDWPVASKNGKASPFRAGVSSFGFGGTNAHIVLEQPPEPRKIRNVNQSHYLIVLSAKSNKSLQGLKANFKQWLEQEGERHRLVDISAGLIMGRDHLSNRSAYVVHSLEDLLTQLSQDLENSETAGSKIDIDDVESIQLAQDTADKILGKLAKSAAKSLDLKTELGGLMAAYCCGAAANFNLLFAKLKIQRISLPTYVFDRQSYWLSNEASKVSRAGAMLHPLVHENTSSLKEQRYTSFFSGREFFLRDHQVQGNKVLPAAAYLEMAAQTLLRAAEKTDVSDDSLAIELRDVIFLRPFVSQGSLAELSIKVFPEIAPHLLPENTVFVNFEVASGFENSSVDTNCHGSAYITESPQTLEPLALQWQSDRVFESGDCYTFLTKKGFEYGKTHQAIERYSSDGRRAFLELQLPESAQKTLTDFRLHPSLIDGGLQGAVALLAGFGEANESDTTVLPFAIDKVYIRGQLHASCYAVIQLQDGDEKAATRKANIAFFNNNPLAEPAEPVISVEGLNCRELVLASKVDAELRKEGPHDQPTNFLQVDGESYYSPSWQPIAAEPLNSKGEATLLVVGENEVAKECVSALQNKYLATKLIRVSDGEQYSEVTSNEFVVPLHRSDELERMFKRLKELNTTPDQVLLIHENNTLEELEDASVDAVTSTAEHLFALVKGAFKPIRKLRLVSLVKGNVHQGAPLIQALSGFYKSIKLEKPTYNGRVVLLDSFDFGKQVILEQLFYELNTDDNRVDLAYSNGRRFGREFHAFNDYAKAEKLSSTTESVGFKKGGTYLITGGLGALGLLVARHLLTTYQAVVYLTGRSELAAEKLAPLEKLCEEGASVNYLRGDVADIAAVKGWVTDIVNAGRELNGIVHSAGVIEDNFLIKKEMSAFQRVLGPKVKGTLALDIATKDQPLDVFVLFSSVTGIFGNLGQCDYGYGNAFEDYFSRYRNVLHREGKRSGCSVSLNWPYWKDGGMQLGEKEEEILFKNFGITPLGNTEGLQALEFSVSHGIPQMAVLEGDQHKVCDVLGVQSADGKGSTSELTGKSLQNNNGQASKEQIFDFLCDVFAKELNIPKERFDLSSNFQAFGFDSVVMIDMVNVLEKSFEGLPRTLFFEYQNLNDLSDFIVAEYGSQFSGTGEGIVKSTSSVATTALSRSAGKTARFYSQLDSDNRFNNDDDRDIAIVGISGRFPEAESITEFWENLKVGKDCISEVPAERGWNMDSIFRDGNPEPGNSYSKWGGFLKDVDTFDPLFFSISPKEAEEMDPHERLFLETVCLAIADAGYRPDKLVKARGVYDNPVGVYAGVMWGDYHLYGIDGNAPGSMSTPHSYYWAVANRVSYQFNFSGPSITIDTACSSSITAMHLAIDALRKGEIDAGIAGGVNLSLHPAKYTLLSNRRFLSSDGRCRSFGTGGDGYVPAEAVGAVILKRKSDALRDGDHIYGIVKSTAINHGGRTSGFTVPNPNRQAALIKDAIQTADINPRDISYVEAHGTGTSLGDPIEISGLTKAFEQTETQYCALGSAKSNIGHAEAAAGVTGLIKILLQMKHQQIVPSLHSSELNPYAKIESSPFVVQQELGKWTVPDGQKRLAALSSFGAGGANGHVIVEEYIPELKEESGQASPHLIVLSARNETSLRKLAESTANYLVEETGLSLTQIAYTLQIGRVSLDVGCALVVSSVDKLISGLNAFARGEALENLWWGKRSGRQPGGLQEGERQLENYLNNRDLEALAESWLSGTEIPWEQLYTAKVQRVSLPGHVFDKGRYWVKHAPIGSSSHTVQSLAPLLDRNISTFDEQLFEKTFYPHESYLRDHRVGESLVLPGVAYLEMVLQAAQQATNNTILGVSQIQWLKPIILEGDSLTVKTGLFIDNYSVDFEIYTGDEKRDVYCTGQIIIEDFCNKSVERSFTIEVELPTKNQLESLSSVLSFSDINAAFDKLGFNFGETFKVIQDIHYSDKCAFATIAPVASITEPYTLYPALMDGAIRASIAAGGFSLDKGMPLPVAAEKIILRKPLTQASKVFSTSTSELGHRSSYDIVVIDDSGELVLAIYGFTVQRVVKLAGTKSKSDAKTAALSKSNVVKTSALSSGVSTADTQQAIVKYLKSLVANATKIPEHQISSDEVLEKYGIDSVMIMTMNEALRETFGDDIPQTLFFEYQSIDELKEYFEENYSANFSVSADNNAQSAVVERQSASESGTAAVESGDALSLVTEFLVGALSEVTKLPTHKIDTEEALENYGVNSVMIMSMNEKMEQAFGDEVPKTLFYEYQNILEIAGFFADNYFQDIITNFSNKSSVVNTPESVAQTSDSGPVADSVPEEAQSDSDGLAILRIFTNELELPESEQVLNLPLREMGIDAVSAMHIDANLDARFPSFRVHKFFEFVTINECITAITGQPLTLAKTNSKAPESLAKGVEPPRRITPRRQRRHRFAQQYQDEPIAVIGLAGRYPQAESLDEFWQNLSKGKDCIVEVPQDRWNYKTNFTGDRTEKGKVYSKWGGFLDSVDQFDPDFFRITMREAEKMDPQERLFLETAAECFEDAGLPRKVLQETSVGVFVGVMWGLYQFTQVSDQQLQFGKPSSSFSSIANRVSYSFDLNGPSMALDTMCSSSISAIQVACQSIQNGDCEIAIAGGVNLATHPIKYELLSQEQFLSSDGRCRAFGEGGTGYVPGEGSGAVLLKPLNKALEDDDQIYGVIQATALNHGGKTNGYTVPNQKAQTAVITKALKRANWPVETVSYIEAHGTGTSLGDPIEVAGLTRAMKLHAENELSEDFKCDIGSIKTNIGHLESAAGIAALTKVLLQLKNKQIVPSLHSDILNKNINFNSTPLRVPQALKEWPENSVSPRRAGISSFGAGGSNAHILVEEFEGNPVVVQEPNQKVLFILSADSDDRLKSYAKRISDWLAISNDRSALFLQRLAYSAQVGRDQLAMRLAVYTNTVEELMQGLQAYVMGDDHSALILNRQGPGNDLNKIIDDDEKQELLDSIIAKSQWERLAMVWTSSLDIDWTRIKGKMFPQYLQQGNEYLRKISFPAKPFMHQRVWVDVAPAGARNPVSLHPLVDKNQSTLFEQIFHKSFTGEEFYLADHIVNTGEPRIILPGVAYLEIARACAEQSIGGEYTAAYIQNLVWAAPIEIKDKAENVHVRISQSHNEYELTFEIVSAEEGVVFCQGSVAFKTHGETNDEWLDIAALKRDAYLVEQHEQIYSEFNDMGFLYGSSYRVTQQRFRLGHKYALSEVILPDQFHSTLNDFVLHPALMDAAVRTGLAADFEPGQLPNHPIVPFGVEHVEILHPLEKHCYSLAYLDETESSDGQLKKYQIVITNAEGKVLVKLHNFTARSFVKNIAKTNEVNIFEYFWKPEQVETTLPSVNTCVLTCGFKHETVEALQQFIGCLVVDIQFSDTTQIGDVLQEGCTFWQVSRNDSDVLSNAVNHLKEINMLPELVFYHADSEVQQDRDTVNPIRELGTLLQVLEQAEPLRDYKLVASYPNANSLESAQGIALSGFAKSLVAVNHRFKMVSVGLEVSETQEPIVKYLIQEAGFAKNSADEVRYLNDEREIRRLRFADAERNSIPVLRTGGTYVITGGLGKLGLIFAKYLAREYAANLVLTGRSPINDTKQEDLDEIQQLGGSVLYVAADISIANDVTNLISVCEKTYGLPNGIIHSAGVADAKSLLEQSMDEFSAIMEPKIAGTLALDEATANIELDIFIVFSSISALVGDLGSGSYACANRFLDAFAQHRQAEVEAGNRYGKTLSINWPLWQEGGMEIPEDQKAFFDFSGIQPLSESEGLDAFESLLNMDNNNLLVAAGETAKLKNYLRVSDEFIPEQNTQVPEQKPIGTLPPANSVKTAAPLLKDSAVSSVKTETPSNNDNSALFEYLRDEVVSVTKLAPEKIDRNTRFEGFGMDSVMLMELQSKLQKSFEKLSKTALFEYDTLAKLCDFIAAQYTETVSGLFGSQALPSNIGTAAQTSGKQNQTAAKESSLRLPSKPQALGGISKAAKPQQINTQNNDIAIIGIGARFPNADTLDDFWQILSNGTSTIQEIPENRWRANDFYAPQVDRIFNKAVSKWGSFIDNIDGFDTDIFGVTFNEACKLDPQVKLMLEATWNALEDAAYTPERINNDRVGVFIGSMSDDFSRVVADGWNEKQQYFGPGAVGSELSNRLSYFFNLNGPSMSIQTACSSSATAIHLARNAILNGECRYALAGGVNVSLHPSKYLMLQDMKVLSPDGKEATFDENANGLVPSEGAGVILMKRYEDALADGDNIYGVIKASCLSHAGVGAGQFLPNLTDMANTAADAIVASGVDPNSISYIECHGTGTELGDPIELKALEKAIAKFTDKKNYCVLGTKANLGHMEAASGVCSVIKVLLSMKHQRLSPCANLINENSVYEAENSPFVLPREARSWTGSEIQLTAGINSFGMGGANAFMVLSSVSPNKNSVGPKQDYPVLLSAKTPEQLKAYAQNLSNFLNSNSQLNLESIAYTTQVGRISMTYRLAVIGNTVKAIAEKLSQWLQDADRDYAGIVAGDPKNKKVSAFTALLGDETGDAYIDSLLKSRKLLPLASLWSMGAEIKWENLYPLKPIKISIPGYPWNRVDTHIRHVMGTPQPEESASKSVLDKVEQDLVVGSWYIIDKSKLDIASLVVDKDGGLGGKIFSTNDWKKQYWDEYFSKFKSKSEIGGVYEFEASGEHLYTSSLSVEQIELIQGFCHQHTLELETLFVAAWSLLLSRISGQKYSQFAHSLSANCVNQFIPFRVPCVVRQSGLEWLQSIQTERLIKHVASDRFSECFAQRKHHELYNSLLVFNKNEIILAVLQELKLSAAVDISYTDDAVAINIHSSEQGFSDKSPEELAFALLGFVIAIVKNPGRNPAAFALQLPSDKKSKNIMRVLDSEGEREL